MLRFINYILYLNESTGSSQNTSGVLHELLVGHHLNGGKHMEQHVDSNGLTPQEAHDKLKASISDDEYNKIHAKAKKAADSIKSIAEKNGHKIHKIHWTSKPGDLERTTGIKASQSDDASDLVVTTKNGKGEKKHHGVSLKVSTNKPSAHIPLSNRGLEATYGGDKIAQEHRDKIHKLHPELKNLPNDPNEQKNDASSKRKRWAKANPKAASNIKKMNTDALHGIAQHLADHLTKSGPHAIVDHLRNHILYAKKTPMQEHGHSHIRHTTYVDGTTEHYDPSHHFEHILSEPHHIKAEKRGSSVVFTHKDKPFARHSLKFNSQSDPISTIKGVGNTSGSKKK